MSRTAAAFAGPHVTEVGRVRARASDHALIAVDLDVGATVWRPSDDGMRSLGLSGPAQRPSVDACAICVGSMCCCQMLGTLACMLKAAALAGLAVLALALSACTAAGGSQGPPPGMPPADSGNAAAGLTYAQQTCASCHAVGVGDMRSPDARARPFDAIANTPGLTRTALNAWLHSSHTNMPDLIVETEQVDDLHAYLLTLKRRN